MKQLDYKVFPSEARTLYVKEDKDYGGAHHYTIQNSVGFNDGKAQYHPSFQTIQFVQKDMDSITPGLQSEQLAQVLMDRCIKLNRKFPSEYNDKMIEGLQIFLQACEDRIQDRIDRGVMGELKK